MIISLFPTGRCYLYNSFCYRGFFREVIIKERMPTQIFSTTCIAIIFLNYVLQSLYINSNVQVEHVLKKIFWKSQHVNGLVPEISSSCNISETYPSSVFQVLFWCVFWSLMCKCSLKVNKSVDIAKSTIFDNILLHVSNQALKVDICFIMEL